MTDLLNLDALAEKERLVQIKGKQYQLVDRTVGQVISAIKAQKDTEEMSESDSIEMMVDLVRQGIPDCPEEVLMRLPIAHLHAIMNFMMQSDEEAVEEAEKEGK